MWADAEGGRASASAARYRSNGNGRRACGDMCALQNGLTAGGRRHARPTASGSGEVGG